MALPVVATAKEGAKPDARAEAAKTVAQAETAKEPAKLKSVLEKPEAPKEKPDLKAAVLEAMPKVPAPTVIPPPPPPNFDVDSKLHPAAAAVPSPAEELHKEARGLINLGTSLTERGDFVAAEIAFRQIMNNRRYAPADLGDALLGLARMHRKQAAYTKAAAVYEKFLKLYPEDPRVPDALLELGRSQRAMGAPRSAINRFYNVINSTLKLPPESYEHYLLLAKTAQFEIAETHFETGNFAEAAKFFDRLRLLDLAPEDRARAHFKSGCSLLNGGESEKAAAKLAQYIDQWPNDVNVPEARYLLARTLRELGRGEEALNITLALLRTESANAATDPKTWAYWQRRTGNQLANDFFQGGDTLSAVAIYEGLARLSDSPSWRLPIIYQTGLCYERLRQHDRATQAYRDIMDSVAQPKGKEPVPPELTELAKMAEWRIGQLEWSDKTETQLTKFFSATNPPPSSARPASTPPPPANDPDASPAATPRAL
ncbi:MAG TPA: tetratricopeptide repeat protein [Lacunisphaera sp.]|nr:tetratricopeptide repeat protein [Lacunisphaera sp.]